MTTITITSPTEAHLDTVDPMALLQAKKMMSYRNKAAAFELKRFQHSRWNKERMGEEEYLAEFHRLKEAAGTHCLLTEESKFPSGLAPRLAELLRCEVQSEVQYPEPHSVGWDRVPDNVPRYYQIKAKDLLVEAKHGAVELATGLGKSTIILQLVRQLGLKTVVMCPSLSIGNQLYKDFVKAFGKAKVGYVGDGKKEYTKRFVIAISNSLALIEEGSVGWNELRKAEVFIADESHLTPASTLQKVCYSLMALAPYRFFFSATQMRGDGLGVVLEGITGKIVMRMDARQGINEGFLARPHFRMIKTPSNGDYSHRDVMRMHRHHVVENPHMAKIIGQLANSSVRLLNTSVLVLIDEIPQFTHILPHLRYAVGFACGGGGSKKREDVPEIYRNQNVDQLVEDFNAGKLPILVGTSAVSTGTDFRGVGHVIYAMGGAAEIPLRQGIGRGTRKPEGKQSFVFTDFDIADVPELHRHANIRREVYADVWEPAQEIEV